MLKSSKLRSSPQMVTQQAQVPDRSRGSAELTQGCCTHQAWRSVN